MGRKDMQDAGLQAQKPASVTAPKVSEGFLFFYNKLNKERQFLFLIWEWCYKSLEGKSLYLITESM